jgi:hypothetical protein
MYLRAKIVTFETILNLKGHDRVIELSRFIARISTEPRLLHFPRIEESLVPTTAS